MSSAIRFSEDVASFEHIRSHLFLCDNNYAPRLSHRTDIATYARKIFERATTFEAWAGSNLVGLVAAYLDNDSVGFVTNVSVIEEFMGKGVAKKLMKMCIDRAVAGDLQELALEVAPDNDRAVRLYRSLGFNSTPDGRHSMVMKLEYVGRKQQ